MVVWNEHSQQRTVALLSESFGVLSAFSKPTPPLLSPFCPEATAVLNLLSFEHVDKPPCGRVEVRWSILSAPGSRVSAKWGVLYLISPVVGLFVCFKQYVTTSTRLSEKT